MKPKDLFLEVAKTVSPSGYEGISERERLEKLQAEFKQRAGEVIDRVLKTLPNVAAFEGDDLTLNHRIKKEAEDYTAPSWKGEERISVSYVDRRGDNKDHLVEVTKVWLCVTTPAEDEFDYFALEDCIIMKQILIGLHHLRFSQNGGQTWGSCLPVESMDIMTSLFNEPINDNAKEKLGRGEIYDSFTEGPAFLERLNDRHPVFSDDFKEVDVAVILPGDITRKHYESPEGYIEGAHAALDDVERALNETV